jgi:hypothetical protein
MLRLGKGHVNESQELCAASAADVHASRNGNPARYSITKYGAPSGVESASNTLATAGWSIRANAWRSESKRASLHPAFDQLKRDPAADRLFLLCQPALAHAPFSDPLQQVIPPAHDARASTAWVEPTPMSFAAAEHGERNRVQPYCSRESAISRRCVDDRE